MDKQKKKEIIIVAVMLLVAILLVMVIKLSDGGSKVKVTVSGKEYGTYDLDKNQTIEIVSDLGTNILEIKDGKANMISATCPDRLCVNMAPLSEGVEGLIVCLPNEVTVELTDE